jgi:long-chain acyl-CoA synthetase
MTEGYPNVPARLLQGIDRYSSSRAQMVKQGAEWQGFTAAEMLRRIAGLSDRLAKLGVARGDRVALFAPNCPEWHVADFAIQGLGAIVVPIYFRESRDRMAYILGHSEAKAIFIAGEEQAKRWREIADWKSSVEKVIFAGGGSGTSPSGSELSGIAEFAYEELIAGAGEAEVEAYRRRVAAVGSDCLASIIYTSGTTGEPKGVMLSHANFTSNSQGSFERFGLQAGIVALSFLPLAHVYERLVDYGYLFNGVSVAYVPRMEDVPQALLEVRPQVCAAVPRFFEKLYGNILEGGHKTKGVQRSIFDWAMRVAREAVPWKAYGRPVSAGVRWQWAVANRLVYKKFREGVGGRLIEFISGGAPLAPELAEFFTTVDMPLYQGYGLTESSPVIATNLPGENHIGTVGRPIPGVETRIAEDGELLVRGPCVMQGYYRKPEETRAAISPDGWLATGDIGRLDADGYLTITDRKKELLKTAGGKLIAPAPIENALKSSPYILNAVVVGDRRPYLAALIVPNLATVQARAQRAGVTISSAKEMVASAWVHELIEGEIKRLTLNLAQFETIKRFALLEREFTFDGGELTFTLKLKRRVIDECYREEIERLYAQPSPARQ